MLLSSKASGSKLDLTPLNEDFQIDTIPVVGYELVLKITNDKVGLKAFIAIHSSKLGPALGGLRIYPYSCDQEALHDVLRLAKGMTYKAAISDVGTGGGKSVIIASPDEDNEEILLAFAEVIDLLEGKYIGAEDSGCTVDDVKVMRKNTKYLVGLDDKYSSGNPAPFTAWGTFRGIQANVKQLYNTDSLEGIKVAIQGLGAVGSIVAEHLFWAGAKLYLSDINEERAKTLADKYGAIFVPSDEILFIECDVLSPSALGGVINDQTIPRLRCKSIAGCANNQLMHDHHASALKLRGILYAPDYLINSGGLLNVIAEIREEGYDPATPRKMVHQIYDTLLGIYEISEKNNMPTVEAANALAEYRIQYGIGKRTSHPVFHHKSI